MASGSSSGRACHLSLTLTATLSCLALPAFALSFLPLTRPWTLRFSTYFYYYRSPVYTKAALGFFFFFCKTWQNRDNFDKTGDDFVQMNTKLAK
jgi:hypothetical protein